MSVELWGIPIDTEQYKAIEKLAEKEGGTPEAWVLVSILKYLEKNAPDMAGWMTERLRRDSPDVLVLAKKF